MTPIQIDAAVLEEIATHLRKFGFSQPAMIADKIDAILRDHAAREQAPQISNSTTPDYKLQKAVEFGRRWYVVTTPDYKRIICYCDGHDPNAETDAVRICDALNATRPPDTPTQSGECAGVCECGHDRDAHNGEFGCLETNGAILICNCKYYRDRARGGR